MKQFLTGCFCVWHEYPSAALAVMPDTMYLLRSPLLTVLQGVGVPPAYGDHPSERDTPQAINNSIHHVHVLSIWSICTLYLRSSASPFAHAGTSHSCSAGKREPLHIAHRTSHTSSAYSRSSHLRWRGSIAVTGANLSLSNRRVDIADQVKEILAGIQTKSMFRCAWAALPGGGETTARCALPPLPLPLVFRARTIVELSKSYMPQPSTVLFALRRWLAGVVSRPGG